MRYGLTTGSISLNQSINELRQTRLSLTQNDLQQQQTLAEIDKELANLIPQYKRQKTLYEKKLISKQDFEERRGGLYLI